MRGASFTLLASIVVAITAGTVVTALAEEPKLEAEISRALLPEIAGAERLLVGVGELHGTNQAPLFVEALARSLALRGYKVVLFLEEPPEREPFYLGENEGETEARLRSSKFWAGAFQDGRAGLQSACVLIRLAALDPDIRLVAVDAAIEGKSRDEAMGEILVKHLGSAQSGKVAGVFWAGNFHVIRRPSQLGPSAFDIAASRLPEFKDLRIDLAARSGSAFNCQRSLCAPHAIGGLSTPLGFEPEGPRSWTYTFRAFTPQMPAISMLTGDSSLARFCTPA